LCATEVLKEVAFRTDPFLKVLCVPCASARDNPVARAWLLAISCELLAIGYELEEKLPTMSFVYKTYLSRRRRT
jgi:hypothetical protein